MPLIEAARALLEAAENLSSGEGIWKSEERFAATVAALRAAVDAEETAVAAATAREKMPENSLAPFPWAHCRRCLNAGRPLSCLHQAVLIAGGVEPYCAQCGAFVCAAPGLLTGNPRAYPEGLPGEEGETLRVLIDAAVDCGALRSPGENGDDPAH